MTNVHEFDGKLSPDAILRLDELEDYTPFEKRIKCSKLLQTTDHFDPVAKRHLNLCIEDIGKEANIDRTNNLVADDLLYLCAEYYCDDEFLKVLETQLCDMETGWCAQGRCSRLYQTLLAFQK
jgi:hypothetical protein